MSTETVLDALERFAAIATDLGAGSERHFRPGLTPAELDQMELQYSILLPDDVRAMWGWRDGVNRDAHSGFGQLFPRLSEALDRGATTLAIRREGDAASIWGQDREPDSSTRWVTLQGGQMSKEIDVTDPTQVDSPVFIQDPIEPLDEYPTFTLTEAIEGWILAVEVGYWYVSEGSWAFRPERVPQTRDRWRM